MNTEKPFVFRASFAELQVGDEILTFRGCGRANRQTITRLTPKTFYCGFGEIENGKHKYENAYSRETGKRIGGYSSDPDAVLPTPEKVNNIAQRQKVERAQIDLKIFAENVGSVGSEAVEIVAWLRANYPQFLPKN